MKKIIRCKNSSFRKYVKKVEKVIIQSEYTTHLFPMFFRRGGLNVQVQEENIIICNTSENTSQKIVKKAKSSQIITITNSYPRRVSSSHANVNLDKPTTSHEPPTRRSLFETQDSIMDDDMEVVVDENNELLK
jgi:hypothetical protein